MFGSPNRGNKTKKNEKSMTRSLSHKSTKKKSQKRPKSLN